MWNSTKRDFISHLPSELFLGILDEAFRDAAPPKTIISRAFLAYQRRAVYRDIKIASPSRFELLARVIECNPRLGGLVESLALKNVDSRGTRTDRRIESLLSELVNLKLLKLGNNSSSIIKVVLSTRVARSSLPRFETFELDDPFAREKPFDSTLYRHLNAFASLRRLEIVHTGMQDFAWFPRIGQKPTKIVELVLRGKAVDFPATVTFVEDFPNLTSLTLDTLASGNPDYTELVPYLPPSLTSLTIRTSFFPDFDDEDRPCDSYLPRFTNLAYLYLGVGTFSENPLGCLRQLTKLRTLGFGREALLDTTRLSLLLGTNGLVNLESVILDQIEGRVGWRIGSDSDGVTLHPDSDENTDHVGPGWELPLWSSDRDDWEFEEHEVQALVCQLRRRGLEVKGTTVEAFGVLEEWEVEIRMCSVAHAYKMGDFDECRERFGDEMVDVILHAGGTQARKRVCREFADADVARSRDWI